MKSLLLIYNGNNKNIRYAWSAIRHPILITLCQILTSDGREGCSYII